MAPDALDLHGVAARDAGRSRVVPQNPAKFSRAHAERLDADALPTLDERGDPPPRAMSVFREVLAAAGEVWEPWSQTRFLDRRFIDTFERWAPPR